MSLRTQASALLGQPVFNIMALHGGDISAVHLLTLENGDTLVAKQGPLVAQEARMLGAIAAIGAAAPQVIACDGDLLLMERVEDGGRLSSGWNDLVDQMAILRSAHGESYGWGEDYAFGKVAMINTRHTSWPAFWAENRLMCHVHDLPRDIARRVETLAARLPDMLPERPAPSLLHGDLWGGNVLVAPAGSCTLIDPACFHGDREVDVAALTLFNNPPDSFFDALDMEPGWRERQPIYCLWPWLLHLRLFGSSYRAPVENALALSGM